MTVVEAAPSTQGRAVGVYLAAIAGGLILASIAYLNVQIYTWVSLACFGAAAATIAAVDVRTRLLPNRFTGPLAVAAAVQVTAMSVQQMDLWIAIGAVIAAAVVFAAYVAMGMVGWFGFGDAKFAAALALFAGIFAGWFAIYAVPLAVLLSGAERAIRIARGGDRRAHAHGPAIAIAAIAVTAIGIVT